MCALDLHFIISVYDIKQEKDWLQGVVYEFMRSNSYTYFAYYDYRMTDKYTIVQLSLCVCVCVCVCWTRLVLQVSLFLQFRIPMIFHPFFMISLGFSAWFSISSLCSLFSTAKSLVLH